MMRTSKTRLLAAVAGLALLGAGTAFAQSAPDTQTRVIQVPKGAVVLVLPPGTMFPGAAMPGMVTAGPAIDAGFPFATMPDAAAMVRQMDQMMVQMQHFFAQPPFAAPDRTIAAALRRAPFDGTMRSVVVTSFSNGQGSCTQSVTYAGNGAAPKVEVRSTGDAACGPLHAVPAAAPAAKTPHLWNVEYHGAPVAAPRLQG